MLPRASASFTHSATKLVRNNSSDLAAIDDAPRLVSTALVGRLGGRVNGRLRGAIGGGREGAAQVEGVERTDYYRSTLSYFTHILISLNKFLDTSLFRIDYSDR